MKLKNTNFLYYRIIMLFIGTLKIISRVSVGLNSSSYFRGVFVPFLLCELIQVHKGMKVFDFICFICNTKIQYKMISEKNLHLFRPSHNVRHKAFLLFDIDTSPFLYFRHRHDEEKIWVELYFEILITEDFSPTYTFANMINSKRTRFFVCVLALWICFHQTHVKIWWRRRKLMLYSLRLDLLFF